MPAATDALGGHRARIRMYRVGLGDCFLLSVRDGETIRHVLIDCGMFAGSRLNKDAKEAEVKRQIVEHIAETTNKKLDVVVVTHEHMDHVSIFNLKKNQMPVFDEIEFDEAWFGWVEDPENETAIELRRKFEGLEADLQAALTGLDQASKSDRGFYADLHNEVAAVAEFMGLAADGTIAEQPRAAMNYVKERCDRIRFGSPGDIWKFAGMAVHVLGPPPGEKQLRTLERAGATYDKGVAAFGAGAGGAGGTAGSAFPESWEQKLVSNEGKLRFADPTVSESSLEMLARYQDDPKDAWRRIDTTALASASTLALQMDSYINNTSLALAFELANGDVLLFPGDAQVGNWESWFDIKEFNVKQLLGKTIFYKVGHHGSHNATLKQALELMNHQDLVAMVPTNESFALGSKSWEMPAPKLHEALLKKTKSRLLRNDQGLSGVEDPLSAGKWGKLKANVVVEELYIDYFV